MGQAGKELRQQMNVLSHAQNRLRWSSMVLIILLFIEPPLWCQNSKDAWSFLSSEERCTLPDGLQPLMFGLPILPPLLSVVAEMVCAVVVFEALWHERKLYLMASSHRLSKFRPSHAWPELFLTIVAVMIVDGLMYALVRQQCFRLAPFGRLALLFYWKRVRSIFWAAVNCLDEFANVFLFVILTVLFFAWFTIMALQNVRESDGADTHTLESVGGAEWGSFTRAVKSYFEMQTGANYPDNIVILVTEMRWTAWIFFPFMFLTFFFVHATDASNSLC